jgi:uncharacterized membrane protein (DUF485 family)
VTTEVPPDPDTPGAVSVEKTTATDLSGVDWEKAQNEPEFRELVRRLRSFIFPVAAAFLVWYLLYVVLSVYAVGFMSTKIGGNITVGLVFGLLQFVSTWAITWWYVRFAARRIDPLAATVRAEIGGEK